MAHIKRDTSTELEGPLGFGLLAKPETMVAASRLLDWQIEQELELPFATNLEHNRGISRKGQIRFWSMK